MNKKFYPFILLSFFFSFTLLAQTVSISGIVTRHNGEPEAGVSVHCTNTTSVVTGIDGVFTFADLPSGVDYEISATKESNPNEFITVLDVLKTADIILNDTNAVSEFQKFACDVNNSGSVSAIDLVELSKIAGKIQGITNPNYWKIFNADYNFIGGCCIVIFLENVTSDVNGLEMIATKTGDVAIDADHVPPPMDSPQPVIYFQDESVAQGEEFEVEILVEDFKKITGFQHTLSWNFAILEFVSTENPLGSKLLAYEGFSDQGSLPVLGTMSNDLEGVTLDDGSVLYSLRFKALSEVASLMSILNFTEELIQKQVVYRPEVFELYIVDASYESATTTIADEPLILNKFEIYPNPVENNLGINVLFENSEKAELILYNSVGKLVHRWNFEGRRINETLRLGNLPQGAYVLKLMTDDGIVAKSLVKL